MYTVILYLIVMMVATWLFQMLAGRLEAIAMLPFGGPSQEQVEMALSSSPKKMLAMLMLKNCLIASCYAIVNMGLTLLFFKVLGGDYWLILVLSIVWSLTIIGIVRAFHWIYLICGTGSLALMWLVTGFWLLVPFVLGALAFVVSMALYWRQVDAIRERRVKLNYFLKG